MRIAIRSTRARISVAYTSAFGIALIAVTFGAWLALASQELGRIDANLTAQLSAARSSVQHLNNGITFLPELSANGMVVNEVFYSGGKVRAYTSGSDRSADMAQWVTSNAANTSSTPLLLNAPFDGVRGLISSVRSGSVNGTLLLTTPLNTYNVDRRDSALALGGSVLLLIIISALVGYRAAGAVLRPVHAVTTSARGLSEHNLGESIAISAPDDEIGELVRTFNSMLGRLAQAFGVQKRLSANAAHELRTPLSMLRAEIEVTLSRPRTEEQYRDSLASLLADANHMSGIVNRLLLVARSEAGALEVNSQPIDLADAVVEAVERSRPMAEQRQIEVSAQTPERCDTSGDAPMIRQLLDNILVNALRYTPEGGRVVVTATSDELFSSIVVDDTGPGIPLDQRAYVLEPFSRISKGPGENQGGAGLGLAMCVAIASAHGGGIEIADSPIGGARVTVRLPRVAGQVSG